MLFRAGINWHKGEHWLHKDQWREEAEGNRLALNQLGLSGVPSFQYNDLILWGQDSLWAIE